MTNNTISSQRLSDGAIDPGPGFHHCSSSDHASLAAKEDARPSITTLACPSNNDMRLDHQKEGHASENDRLLNNTDTQTLHACSGGPSFVSGEPGTSTKKVGELESDSLSTDTATWRPFWLRPIILGTLVGSMVMIMVALSVMMVHSNKNQGLGTFKPGSEFIVLVPSLYQLDQVRVIEPVDLHILDAFQKPDINLDQDLYGDTSALYLSRALHTFNMSQPFGVTQNLSYQRFEPRGSPTTPIKVVVDAAFPEIQCSKLQAYSVYKVYPTSYRRPENLYDHTLELSLDFEGCRKVSLWISDVGTPSKSDSITDLWHINSTLTPARPCQNLPQQGRQFIYFAGTVGQSPSNSSRPDVVNGTAIICAPLIRLSKVQVIDDGINPIVDSVSQDSETPSDVDMWAMNTESIPMDHDWRSWSHRFRFSGPAKVWEILNETTIDNKSSSLDTNHKVMYESVIGLASHMGPLIAHYRLWDNRPSPGSGERLIDVERLIINQIVALWILALSAAAIIALAFSLVRYKRKTLIWHKDPATLLGSLMYFRSRCELMHRTQDAQDDKEVPKPWSKPDFLPYTLRTKVRVIFTFAICGLIIALLFSLQTSNTQNGIKIMRGYWYLLWTSLPSLMALVVTLYVTSYDTALRSLSTIYTISRKESSAEELDVSLLDMLGVSAFIKSMKMAIWPIMVSQSLAIACAFLTTIASVLFTVESDPRPTEIKLTQQSWFGKKALTDPSYLVRRKEIGWRLLRREETNLTYPAYTFDDLLFPRVGSIPESFMDNDKNITVDIKVPAARLHPSCDRILNEDLNRTVLGQTWTPKLETRYEAHTNVSFVCPNGTTTHVNANFVLGDDLSPGNRSYFASVIHAYEGKGIYRKSFHIDYACHKPNETESISVAPIWRTYAWGQFNINRQTLDHLSVWKCQYSWVKTMVAANMIVVNGEILLNPNIRPRPDESTTTAWHPHFRVPPYDNATYLSSDSLAHTNIGLGNLTVSQAVGDDIFKVLVQPVGKIPLEGFGDPEQEQAILESLHKDRAFMSAQIANLENRIDVGEDFPQLPIPSDSLSQMDAVVIDYSRRRLVQNQTATYFLVGILGLSATAHLIILFSAITRRLLGWRRSLLDMDLRGLGPANSTSLYMTAALLIPSNAIQHMPSQPLSKDETLEQLRGLRFRLGWFYRESDQTKHLTIGVLNDERYSFLGTKKDLGGEYSNDQRSSVVSKTGGQWRIAVPANVRACA
ncbi:hypothetical protein K456DRAFT_33096 [Colletotrichum gloeosporioides 23]|nr:hypothetical protein K456DRAFT_33096 [Colletotrichum gloeosporioides 23]